MRFFNQVSFIEATTILAESFPMPSHSERIPIVAAVGHVTAEPICSAFDVPGEDRCLMDGCAVVSAETAAARDRSPVELPTAVPVESGDLLPEGCDAVVMIEDLEDVSGRFRTTKASRPGQHIRRAGSEVRKGAVVLPVGHRIRADETGALATCGVDRVVVRGLRAALIPVGQGLVPPGLRPGPGEVIESNTIRASAFLDGHGVRCTSHPPVRGGVVSIVQALHTATADADLVLVFGGASKGVGDEAVQALQTAGSVLFHGIAMQPGRPTLAGMVDGIPLLVLPGYPFAAGVVLRELVAPLLCAWGFPPAGRESLVQCELGRPVVSEAGVDEFVPLTLGAVGERIVAYPRSRNPASHLADIGPHAFLHIPGGVEGYERGSVHQVRLIVGPEVIERTVFVHGEPGPFLDRLIGSARTEGLCIESIGGHRSTASEALRSRRCHVAVIDSMNGLRIDTVPEIAGRLHGFLEEFRTSDPGLETIDSAN
jgi:putative molybdopterin biosynthesis protein